MRSRCAVTARHATPLWSRRRRRPSRNGSAQGCDLPPACPARRPPDDGRGGRLRGLWYSIRLAAEIDTGAEKPPLLSCGLLCVFHRDVVCGARPCGRGTAYFSDGGRHGALIVWVDVLDTSKANDVKSGSRMEGTPREEEGRACPAAKVRIRQSPHRHLHRLGGPGRTGTGGRISWTFRFCTSTRRVPTRWTRTSTTRRSSRPSTWTR